MCITFVPVNAWADGNQLTRLVRIATLGVVAMNNIMAQIGSDNDARHAIATTKLVSAVAWENKMLIILLKCIILSHFEIARITNKPILLLI